MPELDTSSVKGFKSIASIEELKLRAINVVIDPVASLSLSRYQREEAACFSTTMPTFFQAFHDFRIDVAYRLAPIR